MKKTNPEKPLNIIWANSIKSHNHSQYTWWLTPIHPFSPPSGSVRLGEERVGLVHDRWRRRWRICWAWAQPCVWHLPAKLGQKGTPMASLFVIPCMALCGSLGSASSFSQEYEGVGIPSSELQNSMTSLPTSKEPWSWHVGTEGGTGK